MRSTQVATGIIAKERLAASRPVRFSEAAFGFALRRLSPSSGPAHWKSWEGAEALLIPEPDLKTSQRLVKTFHSSSVTPMLTFGRSSFGPLVAVGAGGAGTRWATL